MARAQRLELHDGLIERLERGEARVCVVGLGYVGLPVALSAAAAGHEVVGIDLQEQRVDHINSGDSYIIDIDSAEIGRLVAARKLSATTDIGRVTDADVVVIAVPTPLDENKVPDLTWIHDAVGAVAGAISEGCLVVLESTSYPGTTEEIVVATLKAQGWTPGYDVFVAYSPERIDPGNETWSLHNTPKVVAGYTDSCLSAALAFYASFVDNLVPVADLATAEMTKLFENTFRLVNIGLVNEFQTICESFGVDVWQVLEACGTKPYGFMKFVPGPGIGGHCIPVDPAYLAWKARERNARTEFIDLASRINEDMPARVVGRIAESLNADNLALRSARVGLLGVAYKKNCADVRESPALPVLDALQEASAIVSYHDPYVPMLVTDGGEMLSEELTPRYLQGLDCVVITADHDTIDWEMVRTHATRVVDTRNALGSRQIPRPR
jgi:UDP-N-acetyl-D-glucosamine dehydrogenase